MLKPIKTKTARAGGGTFAIVGDLILSFSAFGIIPAIKSFRRGQWC